MAKSEQVIKDLDRVIGLINTDMKDIPAEEKKQMVADTIDHFDNYVSPGWLKYRKSVSSDSEQGAVLERQDEGAYCYGLKRRKIYRLSWRIWYLHLWSQKSGDSENRKRQLDIRHFIFRSFLMVHLHICEVCRNQLGTTFHPKHRSIQPKVNRVTHRRCNAHSMPKRAGFLRASEL